MYLSATDILEWIEKHAGDNTAQLIRTGIYPLVSKNSFIDELHFGDSSDGYYYATLSPDTVEEVASAFNSLDLQSIYNLLSEKWPGDDLNRIRDAEEFIQYLKQWLQLINKARDKRMGIIGHMG